MSTITMLRSHGASLEDLPLALPARQLALAWLAVAPAASSDADRPAYYRIVNLDVHRDGVVLAATDTYWAARAYVPFDGDWEAAEVPAADARPEWSVPIVDADHRVRDLMRFLERSTRPKKGEEETFRSPVSVLISAVDPFADLEGVEVEISPSLDPSLDPPMVAVEVPDAERLLVRRGEIPFPPWSLFPSTPATVAERTTFGPGFLKSMATSVAVFGGVGARITLLENGAIAFEARCDRHLSGLIMPQRDVEPDEAES